MDEFKPWGEVLALVASVLSILIPVMLAINGVRIELQASIADAESRTEARILASEERISHRIDWHSHPDLAKTSSVKEAE